MKTYDLNNKTALITGASRGIGRELAKQLASLGTHCILTSHPDEKDILEALSRELKSEYPVTTWITTADLSDSQGPDRLHAFVINSVKKDIDILVNNAGVISYGLFHEVPRSDHQKTVSVNLSAVMQLMNLFIPGMVARGSGIVYNICSVSAFVPTPHHAIYGATKSFIQSLSESVNSELKGTGVRVVTLNPGYTSTDLIKKNNFPEKLLFYRFAGVMRPEAVAFQGVRALRSMKERFIPGVRNRLIFSVLLPLGPRKLVNYITDKMTGGV